MKNIGIFYLFFFSFLVVKFSIYLIGRVFVMQCTGNTGGFPVGFLHKSIAGRYRPVRVADGPITARCRFM